MIIATSGRLAFQALKPAVQTVKPLAQQLVKNAFQSALARVAWDTFWLVILKG